MKIQIAKRILSVLLSVCMLAASMMLPIFAVNTWNAADNVRIYVATDSKSIDIYDNNEPVIRYANLFAKEYESKFGVRPLIYYGAKAKAQNGDIVLDLNPAYGIASEGFSISVSSSKLIVSASDYTGLFYGCREVLKQLLVDNTVETVTNNVPHMAERSVFLDNSRKHFSPDWIKNLICEMSWAGMNILVTNLNAYLTQEQFADIAEYAALYRVELVSSNNPVTPNAPQITVKGDTLYIRCDNPALYTPAQMMEEIKPLLHALSAKFWDTSADPDENNAAFTEIWAKIGNAPVVELPDDNAVVALIEEFYKTYQSKEDIYTAPSFEMYEADVLNAEHFIGLNRICWEQNTFDMLAINIRESRDSLVLLGDTKRVLMAMAAYELKLPSKAKYSPESWSMFEASYIACKNMLAARDYDEEKVFAMTGGLLVFAEMGLILEDDVAGLRKEGLTSAKFQYSTVYQGGMAKMNVIVPRGNGIDKIVVVDENGIEVAFGKAQPINIRNPRQVTYVVNIPATELGTHTYTVYATYKNPAGILCDYLYCSDPIQCKITVVE